MLRVAAVAAAQECLDLFREKLPLAFVGNKFGRKFHSSIGGLVGTTSNTRKTAEFREEREMINRLNGHRGPWILIVWGVGGV